jgi:zinc protease
MALGVAENDDIVSQLSSMAFYGMPLDYLQWFDQQVRQVTAESIRAAFQRNLDPDALIILSIGREPVALTPTTEPVGTATEPHSDAAARTTNPDTADD